MNKIAFLIPCKGEKDWESIEDSILLKNTLSTFIPEKNHQYYFFIGFDHDDSFYSKNKIQTKIIKKYPNYIFKFIEFSDTVLKGHLTKMWNILYFNALTDDDYITYFYQCGDDIIFKKQGWVQESMNKLIRNDNLGIAGPLNDHPYLLTQVMVTRLHYKIFNFLFPEYIFNWGCDDWINLVYLDKHRFILKEYLCLNSGGTPRYETKNYNLISLKKTVAIKAENEKSKLNKYLSVKEKKPIHVDITSVI